MYSCKTTATRTYTRKLKNCEEGTSILGLDYGEIPVEYESACRLCLDKSEVMSEIFGDLDNIVPITVKIKNLLGLEVNEDDRLPTLICDGCLHQLNNAYNFKKRCLASDVKLRQYLYSPLKPPTCTFVDLEKAEAPDSSSCVEDLVSLNPLKEECTISWDDQVPLAAIITSAIPEISTNKVPKSRNTKYLPGTWEGVSGGWSKKCAEENQNNNETTRKGKNLKEDPSNGNSEYDEEAQLNNKTGVNRKRKQLCYSPTAQKKTPVKKTESQAVKTYNIVQSSGYVCKITSGKHEEKPVDLDDVPLSERVRIERRRLVSIKARRKKKNSLPEGLVLGDENEVEVEFSLKKKKGKRSARSLYRNTYVCPECSKAFLSPSLLARHARVHTGEKPFICEICDNAFSQNEILQRHKLQVHTKHKPHRCKHCGKGYGSYSILAAHVRSAHVQTQYYKCPLCPKVFCHPSGLSRHQNIHNGTYFYCKICGKHFNDGSSVKRHLKVHTGVE